MKGLKGFDFFQKISVDSVTQPTIIGSILSLSAISLMIFLIFTEIVDFFTPKIKTEQIVIQDKDQTSRIKMELAIQFHNLPCQLISVDSEDSLRNHRLDIHDTLRKVKMLPHLNFENYDHSEKMSSNEAMMKAISENVYCNIIGYVPISKVPGNVHISFHNYADKFEFLRSTRKDLYSKISMNHKINVLYFGDVNTYILQMFGYDMNSFNHFYDLPDFSKEITKKDYDYFLKLIRYIFYDESTNTQYEAYQFSMTVKESPYDPNGEDMPMVMIRHELSPITMKVTKKAKSFLHFITHICAIIGGIFVVFSIFNRMIVTYFDFSSSDHRGVMQK